MKIKDLDQLQKARKILDKAQSFLLLGVELEDDNELNKESDFYGRINDVINDIDSVLENPNIFRFTGEKSNCFS
jgi:hypothetical protein